MLNNVTKLIEIQLVGVFSLSADKDELLIIKARQEGIANKRKSFRNLVTIEEAMAI
jgi:hypothetical protein